MNSTAYVLDPFRTPWFKPTANARLQAIENQIRDIKSGANDAHYNVAHKTVFNELLNSDLPPEEKSAERLKHEGKPHMRSFPRRFYCRNLTAKQPHPS